LPRSADDWARYDVVILGDLGPAQLDSAMQRALHEYVSRRGGNVILVAGTEFMPAAFKGAPLMDLVPVESRGALRADIPFMLSLPEETRQDGAILVRDTFDASQIVWKKASALMPVYGLSEYSVPKPKTRTLISATTKGGNPGRDATSERAFFCWRPVGSGRVAYLSAPQSYLLRSLRGDRDHHRFWGQTLRWLTAAQTGAGTDLVRVQTDRATYDLGQPAEVVVWLKDEAGRPIANGQLRADARSLDKTVASIRLLPDAVVAGRYSGVFERLPSGTFQITPAGDAVDKLATGAKSAAPGPPSTVNASQDVEMLNTQANRPLLEQLAELTGGQVLPPTAVAEVLEQASLDPKVTEATQREPLWNRWSYLLIVLGCLFTEWVVRKHKGLA
jgi:hypothetical protein